MELFPLLNSIRIASISTIISFFIGIFIANKVERFSSIVQSFFDLIFTLPLVLPPTVVGFLLLRVISPASLFGKFLLKNFDISLAMSWQASVIATTIVIFPLMYRTARGAFESFDSEIEYSARCLGLSRTYTFWKIKMPFCKNTILAGVVLSFARAIGEYGATSMVSGYIKGKTATISTTVYQFWRVGQDDMAFKWVIINIMMSLVFLLILNLNKRKI